MAKEMLQSGLSRAAAMSIMSCPRPTECSPVGAREAGTAAQLCAQEEREMARQRIISICPRRFHDSRGQKKVLK